MKKLLLMLLGVLFALPALAANGDNFQYTYEGQTLTYTIISEADKTVKTKDGSSSSAGNSVSGDLILPEKLQYNGSEYTLIEIGNSAFYLYCTRLTSVEIPNSVTTIGNSAFDYCRGLTSVTIGNSVTTIGNYAFNGCTGLTSVTIPNSVTTIGNNAFGSCTDLTSVTIGNSVTTIGNNAFYGCTKLVKSAYPSTISDPFPRGTRIKYPAEGFVDEDGVVWGPAKSAIYFAPLDLEGEFTIPNSVTTIGNSAFSSCSGLTSVEIPESVKTIGESSFSGCTGLTSVDIPNSVTSIGEYAFMGCSGLKSVTIGNSVATIGNSAFYYCSGLTSVEIPESVTTIGSEAFWGCTGLTSVEIGNSVTTIDTSAFYYCSGLTSITIPESVTSIGSDAFYGCTGLTKVEISDLAAWCNIYFDGPNANPLYFAKHLYMNGGEITELIIPNSVTEIGINAFRNCTGLTSVEIGNSTTSIGNYAFQSCTGLTRVEIGNSTTSIGNYAFQNCTGLTRVTIPNSVTTIGTNAFESCSGLTSVIIGNSVTSIGINAFRSCNGLVKSAYPSTMSNPFSNIGLTIPYPAEGFVDEDGFVWGPDKSAIYFAPLDLNGEFTIPNSVTTIGNSAFRNCSGLTSVIIPNSVTSIGDYAFSSCNGLVKSAYPSTMTNPFSNGLAIPCPAEGSVVEDGFVWGPDKSAIYFAPLDLEGEFIIPTSVTTIGESAFYGCSGLTSVEIPESVTTIGNSAFNGCTLKSIELKSVTPPNYYSVFDSMKKTTTLIIPDGTYNEYLKTDWQNFLSIREASGNELCFFNDQVFTYRYIADSSEAVVVNNNYSSMTSASIPDRIYVDEGDFQGFYKVTGIAANAFNGCKNLKQLKISANCTFIGDNAFSGCSGLTSVAIPNLVTTIGESAFYGCTGLTKVEISDMAAWCNIDFSNAPANPLYYAKHLYQNDSEIIDLVIPDAVTSIGNYTFYNCSGLTSVEIPDSVATIGNSAFYNCTGLTKVEISDMAAWCNIDFADGYANPLYYAKHLYMSGGEITDLVIPDAVTSIGSSAFFGCTGLTSVTISESVTSIGESAFTGASKIASLTLEDGYNDLIIGNNAFGSVNPTSVFFGRNINGELPQAADLTVGAYVTSIPDNFYKNSKKLESLTIINGLLETIGASAFQGCQSLKEVTFPKNYVEIGENAFASTGLTELTLPSGEIAANAFSGNKLTEVVFGSEVTVIGENAFNGNNSIGNVYSTRTMPPAAQNNSFSYYEAQLWVPEEAVETYYNTAPCWYRFTGKALVIPEEVTVTGVPKIEGNPGETFQLTAELSPAGVTLDRILWHSTNPAMATVDNNGLVTIHNFDLSDASDEVMRALADSETRTVQIIASTLYEDSPTAVVTIDFETLGIDYVNSDSHFGNGSNDRPNDIYNLQGVCLKRNASQDDVDALVPGLYIIGGKKVLVK